MVKWLKLYLAALPKIVDEGRLYEGHAKRIAKGLKYSIAALEDSKSQWVKEQKKNSEDEYRKAVDRFGV
jgi:hypothetical protein